MQHDTEAYERAFPDLEKIVQAHRVLGDEEPLRDRLLDLGICALRTGRPAIARAAYEEAMELDARLKPHPQRAGALLNLGDARRECGDLDSAFDAYGGALTEARRTGNAGDEEAALKARAFVAAEEGRFERAVPGYHALRDFYLAAKRVADAAQVTIALDFAEGWQGRRLGAEEMARAVHESDDGAGIAEVQVMALWRTAFALRDEGRLEEALERAEQAWAIAGGIDDPAIEASAANNVATLLSYAGDPVAANDVLDRALELLRKTDEPARLVASLCTKAELERSLGNEKAQYDALTEASAVARTHLAGTPAEGQVLLELSKLDETADSSWTLEVRERVVELCDQPGADRLAIRALLGLATAQEHVGDVNAARLTLDAALSRSQAARMEGEMHSVLLARAHLLDRIGRRPEASQELEHACAIAERWRAAIGAKDMRRDYFAEVVESHRVLACWRADAGEVSAAFRHAELSRTRTLLDALGGGETGLLDLAEVQLQLGQRNAALLEYIVPVSHPATLLCVTPERAHAVTLGMRSEIVNGVRRLRATLEGNGDACAAAHTLHEILITPVIEECRDRELWIAPDGPLDAVPFALLTAQPSMRRLRLPDDGDTELLAEYRSFLLAGVRQPEWPQLQPLVARHALRILASASASLRASSSTSGDVLVIAAPLDEPATTVDNLPPLNGAREEAETVKTFWARTSEVEFLSGTAATKARFLKAAARGPWRALHFAGHAIASDRNPAASALILGPGHAGRLSAGEIAREKIQADIVVLSACETGLGPSVDGEGTLSLARAFLTAGVGQVLLSLWQVEDRATADLMAAFHARLSQGTRPEEALRAAQLSAFSGRSRAWAAFAVVG